MAKIMKYSTCCQDGAGDEPGSKDCLDKWKEQLEDVCNQYNEASAITSKHREKYVNSLGWETKLKNWDDIIKKADEKAKVVVNELEFFIEQVKIVCENSANTTEALEKLICLVKTIFDCFFTYEENRKGLKDKIKDFKKIIECLTSVDEEDKAEVIKCIEAYEQKIVLVCEMQDAVLTKLIETLKCADLLDAYICDEDGLKDKLNDILIDFKGENMHGEHCGAKEEEEHNHDDITKYPCHDKKAKPMPKFPINTSKYYTKIGEDLGKAIDETKSLETSWINSKKISDKFLSQKNSLTEAIKAAEAAESGK